LFVICARKVISFACSPAVVLMVGDSRSADVKGARAAGLRAVHLHRNQEGTSGICSLADLVDMIERSE